MTLQNIMSRAQSRLLSRKLRDGFDPWGLGRRYAEEGQHGLTPNKVYHQGLTKRH